MSGRTYPKNVGYLKSHSQELINGDLMEKED